MNLNKNFSDEYLLCNRLHGAVTAAEARVLADLVASSGARICLDIGVANGGSALAMAKSLAAIGGSLHGIDPMQIVEHDRVAEKLLASFGLSHIFKLHAMPTHLAGPKLMEEGVLFDMVFIDGMHCFEYKSIDAFFGDRLLKVGGYLIYLKGWWGGLGATREMAEQKAGLPAERFSVGHFRELLGKLAIRAA